MSVNQTLEQFLQLNWLCTANVEAATVHLSRLGVTKVRCIRDYETNRIVNEVS